jgi:hypothetical protein
MCLCSQIPAEVHLSKPRLVYIGLACLPTWGLPTLADPSRRWCVYHGQPWPTWVHLFRLEQVDQPQQGSADGSAKVGVVCLHICLLGSSRPVPTGRSECSEIICMLPLWCSFPWTLKVVDNEIVHLGIGEAVDLIGPPVDIVECSVQLRKNQKMGWKTVRLIQAHKCTQVSMGLPSHSYEKSRKGLVNGSAGRDLVFLGALFSSSMALAEAGLVKTILYVWGAHRRSVLRHGKNTPWPGTCSARNHCWCLSRSPWKSR